jgi:signal transduction histidine kinase
VPDYEVVFNNRNLEGTNEIKSVFWIGTTVMLFLAFGLIFLVLFYQNYFTRMKRKEAELLLRASLESEKQERQRIAADLHDSVSSDLSAIRNYLVILQKGEIDKQKKELYQELKDGVETAIENTRMVSYKLMPPLIEISGLAIALEDMFEKLNKKTQADFAINTTEGNLFFEPSTAYELFRVIQEFTTNMLKYGTITKCSVNLSSQKDDICIAIIDDGIPYNFKNLLKTSKGTGIKNINSRLKVIQAVLTQRETTVGNHFEIILKNPKC